MVLGKVAQASLVLSAAGWSNSVCGAFPRHLRQQASLLTALKWERRKKGQVCFAALRNPLL